jgi:hypothetical protein
MWQWANANGDGIAAVAAILTLAVAILVFSEARKIRRTEWLLRQNQAWNELGNAVAQFHDGCRIGEMLTGEAVKGELTPKEAFLLMSFFNVVSSEYHAFRAKAIHQDYVIHSLSMTARIVVANKSWIFDFLKTYGYEASFVRALAIVAVLGHDIEKRGRALRRELLASSRVGTFCGPKVRAWLRKEFSHGEIDDLCS